jgi:hypothetical protein
MTRFEFKCRISGYASRGNSGATDSDRHAGEHCALRGGGRNACPDNCPGASEYSVSRPLFYFDQPGGRQRGGAADTGLAVRSFVKRNAGRYRNPGALENGLPGLVLPCARCWACLGWFCGWLALRLRTSGVSTWADFCCSCCTFPERRAPNSANRDYSVNLWRGLAAISPP